MAKLSTTKNNSPKIRNPQFLPNLNETWSKLWIFITNELFSIGNFFMNQSLPAKDQHNRVRTKNFTDCIRHLPKST